MEAVQPRRKAKTKKAQAKQSASQPSIAPIPSASDPVVVPATNGATAETAENATPVATAVAVDSVAEEVIAAEGNATGGIDADNALEEPAVSAPVVEAPAVTSETSLAPTAPPLVLVNESAAAPAVASAPPLQWIESDAADTRAHVTETVATAPPMQAVFESVYPAIDLIADMEVPLPRAIGSGLMPFAPADIAAIYSNPLLDAHDDFIVDFYEGWKLDGRETDNELYAAIERYRQALVGVVASRAAVSALDKSCDEAADAAWVMQRHDKVSDGVCRDNVHVKHRVEYEFAVFRREAADELRRRLERLRREATERKVLSAYDAESARAEADLILDDFFSSCAFSEHLRSMPTGYVALHDPNDEAKRRPREYDSDVATLRGYLDVLFHFERLPEPKPMALTHAVREWILSCAAALLSVATSEDHRFLLLHLLEAPAGVGTWAAHLVQFPNDVWTNYAVDHFGALLHILLRPIAAGGGGERRSRAASPPPAAAGASVMADGEREKARPELSRALSSTSDEWVFLDSRSESMASLGAAAKRRLSRVVENVHAPSEDDVVAILDQLPFGDLFRCVLGIETEGGEGASVLGPRLTADRLLVLFAFAEYFSNELSAAFDRYPPGTHQTILRRVGRLITQILCYVSARYAEHRESRAPEEESGRMASSLLPPGWDPSLSPTPLRLSVEFDALVERCALRFMRARGLSVWQFLADLPFEGLSQETLWRLFLLMFTGWSGSEFGIPPGFMQVETASAWSARLAHDASVRERFHDALMTSPTSDVFFLLTTLGHVCCALPSHSPAIPVIVSEIEAAAYGSSSPARELTMAPARDVLCTIAHAHPHTMSLLLERAASAANDAHRSVYIHLFDKQKGIPIERWRPTDDDMQRIRSLLSMPIDAPGCKIARLVLGQLDFGAADARPDARTILPRTLHRRVAAMIEERVAGIPVPSQLGMVGHVVSGRLALEREFVDFCWTVLMSLSLRTNPTGADAECAPLAESDSACQALCARAAASPLSAFVALQTSVYGYDYTAFRTRGLQMLSVLVAGERVDAAFTVLVDALSRMVLTNARDLSGDAAFVGIVSQLLHSEVTLTGTPLRYLVRWIAPVASEQGEPTDFVNMLLAMVRAQIGGRLARPGEPYPSSIEWIEFWLRTLFTVSDWHKDAPCRRALNSLMRSAAAVDGARTIVRRYLGDEHKRIFDNDPEAARGQHGLAGALRAWMAGTPPPRSFATQPSVLYGKQSRADPYASSCDASRPWLVFECLVMETWRELELRREVGYAGLRQPGASIETLVKTSALHVPFPVEQFMIYRWADFAASLEPGCTVLPLAWQMFFSVYFAVARTEKVAGAPVRERFIGPIFFGPQQRPLLDRLRARLNELATFYTERSARPPSAAVVSSIAGVTDASSARASAGSPGLLAAMSASGGADERPRSMSGGSLRDKNLAALFAGMKLWLSDTRLATPGTTQLETLPAVYEVARLVVVIAGDCLGHPEDTLWWDLVDIDAARHAMRVAAEAWMGRRQRHGARSTSPTPRRPLVTGESILKSISLEVARLGPPDFAPSPPSVSVDKALLNSIRLPQYVVEAVGGDLELIAGAAEDHARLAAQLCALDADYGELLCRLYDNVPEDLRLDIPCDQRRANRVCAGPARLVFRFSQRKLHQGIAQAIADNRRIYKDAIKSDQKVPADVCRALLRVRRTVRALVLPRAQAASLRQSARGMALHLFYHILSTAEESARVFPPALSLYHGAVREIGARYVAPEPAEASNLLDALIAHPDRVDLAVALFEPWRSQRTLDLYSRVKACLSRSSHGVRFVTALLARFDLARWAAGNPAVRDRRELLGAVVKGLGAYGALPPADLAPVVAEERAMVRALLLSSFQDLHADALSFLLRECVDGRVPVDCWWDYLASFVPASMLPASPANVAPSAAPDVGAMVTLLSEFFAGRRRAAGSLFAAWGPYVPALCVLFRYLCSKLAEGRGSVDRDDAQVAQDAFDGVWAQVCGLYSPWLTSEGRGQPAWTPDAAAAHPDAVIGVSSAFGAAVSAVHAAMPGLLAIAHGIVGFYVHSLAPNAPDYVLTVLHDSLLVAVPWRAFVATPTLVRDLLRVTENASCASVVFASAVLPTLDWARSLSVPLASDFYRDLLLLLLRVAAEPRAICRDEYVRFLEHAHSFSWDALTPADYTAVSTSAAVRGRGAAAFQERSPLATALRLLRAAADVGSHGTWQSAAHFRSSVEKLRAFVRYAIDTLAPATDLAPYQYDAAATELLRYAGAVAVGSPDLHDVTADACADAGGALVRDVLQLLNRCEGGEAAVDALFTATLRYVEMEAPGELTCPFLAASTRLSSVRRVARLCDACIFRFFDRGMDAAAAAAYGNSGLGGWEPVLRNFQPPELTYEEFLDSCVAEGCGLVLHAHVLQLLQSCQGAAGTGALRQLERDLANWIVRTAEVRPPLDAQRPKGAAGAAPRECAYLLLIGRYVLLLLHLSGVENAAQDRSASDRLSKACGAVARLGEDKESGGFLGMIGLGKKSAYCPEFRLACKALAAFMGVRGGVEAASDYCSSLVDAKKSAQYARNVLDVEAFLEGARSPTGGLLSGPSYVADIVRRLFPGVRFLRCLSNVA